jgi:hypothetical protein
MAICVVLLGACNGNPAITADAAVADPAVPDAAAALAATPMTMDFGANLIACPSAPLTIAIANPGGSSAGPLATTISGANASAFEIVSDGCAGTHLAPGATCTIALRFAGVAAGAATADVEVAAPHASAMVAMTGTTNTTSELVISPGQIDFGSVAIGTTSPSQTATITNTCLTAPHPSGAFQVSSLAGSDPSQFAIVADQCSGVALAGGASCTLGVAYAPTVAGPKSAYASIMANAGGLLNLSLRGE